MKILNFGLPRTRSSYLVDVLSQAYNLDNLFEPYHNDIIDKIIADKLKGDDAWKYSIDFTLNLTNNLYNKNDFILKLFPDACFNFHLDPFKGQTKFIFQASDYFDLTKSHNLQMYDKIYITYRENYVDLICSFLLAQKKQTFLYTDKNKNLIKFNKPKNLTLDYSIMELTRLTLSFYFFEHYCDILKTLPNVTCIEYNDIPKYLKYEYPDVTSTFIDTEFDYVNKIKNYNQISDDYYCLREKFEVTLLTK